jgi:hypothetical protein
MAHLLNAYIQSRGFTLPAKAASTFADETLIASWALNSVKAMQTGGLIEGKPGNLYDPKTSATRAEVAALFTRFIGVVAP